MSDSSKLEARSSTDGAPSSTQETRSSHDTFPHHNQPLSQEEHYFPDGGFRAWFTVLGGVAMSFCTGQVTAFGVFETWYTEHQLQNVSPSTISWISSIQLWLVYGTGAIFGRLFDAYGPHYILFLGSMLLVFSTMITSICKEYYQFLIVQGLLTGVSYGMLFYPSFASISTHFRKYRATAVGITIAGSGIAGMVFPIMYRNLFPRIGFGWAVRVGGFIQLGCCLFGCVAITSRITPGRGPKTRVLPDAKTLQDLPFICLVIGCFFVNFGLFIPLTYLPNYAISRGISSDISFYIVSATNAGSIVGRVVPALIADAIGRFNIIVPSTFFMGLLALLLWTFASSFSSIVAFGVLYGCFAGNFLAMQIPCVTQISAIKEVGTRIGILYSISSFGVLAGSPVAGVILQANGGSYRGMMILCGVFHICGSLLLLCSRLGVNSHILVRV